MILVIVVPSRPKEGGIKATTGQAAGASKVWCVQQHHRWKPHPLLCIQNASARLLGAEVPAEHTCTKRRYQAIQ